MDKWSVVWNECRNRKLPFTCWISLWALATWSVISDRSIFKFKFKIQKRLIETHIHIQKWYIKFLCHSTEGDSSLRYINSTLDNMCINEGRQKPGSLYGPHYDAWSVPDSDITRANADPAWDGGTHAGPTLGQVTPSSGNCILYWSYDVALVSKPPPVQIKQEYSWDHDEWLSNPSTTEKNPASPRSHVQF